MLPADMPTVPPQPTRDPGRLTGVKIGIDPGHQAHANSAQEAIAPAVPRRKPRYPPHFRPLYRVPEYEVNLDISLQLRDAPGGAGLRGVHDARDE